MECKGDIVGYEDLYHMYWNISRMECKVNLDRVTHFKNSDWNISRMECKEVLSLLSSDYIHH